MTFQSPLFLLGALAALIPLLVHLFDRRRPRPHPFAAISFVLRSQRRTASRLRLKRLVLYALRTLIFLALPVALARPAWKKDAATGLPGKGPAATVIVLDTSLSMRWTDGAPLFERAKDEARAALRELLPDEPASIVLCGGRALAPPAPGFDRGRLRTTIDEAQAGFEPADLSFCLELAARALEESPLPGKRVVLVSDFAGASVSLEKPPPTVTGPKGERIRLEVVLRDAAEGRAELPNHAIVELKIEPAVQVGPRAYQFTFTVKNFSSTPAKDLEATLEVGDRIVAKGFLDVAPGGTAQKSLTHRFEVGGPVAGAVAIAPDALADDDRRAFVLSVPRDLRVLAVNGSPNTVRFRDEAFFVEAALTSPGSPAQVVIRDSEAAWREDLSGYQVVLLLNVLSPSPEHAQALHEFVSRGGGLFLAMGDHVDAEAYNQSLAALLPRPLRVAKTTSSPSEPEGLARAGRLAQVSFSHPVFTVFDGPARDGLLGARFHRYMLLEAEPTAPGDTPSSEVVASFEDGAPALALARRGRGRVMLFTSTIDRDWSDFAIRTSFLPFMQRSSAYLAGSLDEREELRPRVGRTVSLAGDTSSPPALVRTPSGQELAVRRSAEGAPLVGPLSEPGVHTVRSEDKSPLPGLDFTVTLDPSESDLSRQAGDELRSYFGEDVVRVASVGGASPQTPLWTTLIVLAVLAFFVEGLLLRG